MKTVFTTGETVGLGEWIINDTCLVSFSLKHPSKYVGKKPRKYTIPAKPYPPNPMGQMSKNGGRALTNSAVESNQDQVRIYRGDKQNMNQNNPGYTRVRQCGVMVLRFGCNLSFGMLNSNHPFCSGRVACFQK